METTMLKKMSVALLAASLLAGPALAAGSAKNSAAAKNEQTAATPLKRQAKPAEANSTSGNRHLKQVARHHRAEHRHYAHRHHKKVSTMHASAKSHGFAKTRLGLHQAGHKVGFNKIKKTGAKLSFKHVKPATRRG
jgi:hypothetical protein